MYLYTRREREGGEQIMNSAPLTSSAIHPTKAAAAAAVTLLFSMLSCSWPGCPLIAVSCLYRAAETGSFGIMCQWLYSASYDLCTSTQHTHTVKCTNAWSKWQSVSTLSSPLEKVAGAVNKRRKRHDFVRARKASKHANKIRWGGWGRPGLRCMMDDGLIQ